ncbi:hypothetical protein DM01DRAFT_1332511 [Hesseltinella vesiculosa]|uniref:Uncharacterized protein n=1 Tax=Hesseltinella vesiculosa TaxID=101127 RepID=A0A1X2GS29_9FUNG|nr:hypothetical protein DM01DRAFT_1332511 [Hesseltinella vesiculosa]
MAHLQYILVLLGMMLAITQAQVGPTIYSPAENSTIAPNQKLNINFSYQNLGTGTYTLDVSFWQDPSASQLIATVLTGSSLPSGSSSGTTIAFSMNGSVSVTAPSSLNETFYMTLTEHVSTQGNQNVSVKSMPMMLHSGAMAHLPTSLSALLLISLAVVGLSSLF